MGIPAWIWFVIAAVLAVAGLVLLMHDRGEHPIADRERRKWASLRGWTYTEVDPLLLQRWHGGSVAYFGGGQAHDVVTGTTFTADGRRPLYLLDQVSRHETDCTLVAVRTRRRAPTLLEMWLPSVPFQHEHMPELLGPIGQRYGFVGDLTIGRNMITNDLVNAVEDIGGDVNVVWVESDWVLAAAPPGIGIARLERLLRDLGAVADVLDPFESDEDFQPGGRHSPAPARPAEADARHPDSVTRPPDPSAQDAGTVDDG